MTTTEAATATQPEVASAQPQPDSVRAEATNVTAKPRRVRPRWWIELLAIIACDRLYEYIRNLVPTHQSEAESRGRAVERLESDLHINFGLWLNRLVARHDLLAQAMNYYYASLWLFATIAMLVWLYVARPEYYRRMRSILGIITLLGLVGFYLYPLAPPRLLPELGYIDTIVRYRTWGSWADPTVATHSNQYAAMPSLHTAWALWCGYALWAVSRHTWVKVVAVLYPLLTVIVIVGTANHFLLDAVGGLVIFLIAVGIQAGCTSLWRRRKRRLRDATNATAPPQAAQSIAP